MKCQMFALLNIEPVRLCKRLEEENTTLKISKLNPHPNKALDHTTTVLLVTNTLCTADHTT